MNKLIEENKRLIFILTSWILGSVLIINFKNLLFCDKLQNVNGFQFALICFALILFLLPFLDKVKISTSGFELSHSIDKALEKVKKTINDTKEKSEIADKTKIEEVDNENDDILSYESDSNWRIVKYRIEIEQALRIILNKRQSIEKAKSTDIKYYSLGKLVAFYIKEYPEAVEMRESFQLFNQIANGVIHGQKLSHEQMSKGNELGLNIMRYLKIKKIQEKIQEKK